MYTFKLLGKIRRFDLTPQTLMTTGEDCGGLLNRLQEDVEIVVLDSRANLPNTIVSLFP